MYAEKYRLGCKGRPFHKMKPKSSNSKSPTKPPAERVVKDIRRQTRRHFSAEDKIRIVLEGLRGDDTKPRGSQRGRPSYFSDGSDRET